MGHAILQASAHLGVLKDPNWQIKESKPLLLHSFLLFFNMIPLAGKSGLAAADFPLTLLESKMALPAVSLVKMIPGLPLLSFHLITIGQMQHHQMLKV